MDPYIGEVRLVGFNFAPVDWAVCNGQLLPIQGYEALYTLVGTTYGGDGQTNFGLPNLQGRVPIHQGTSSFGTTYFAGEVGGVEQVSLTVTQYPSHDHNLMVSKDNATGNAPKDNVLGNNIEAYGNKVPSIPMNAVMVTPAPGSALPHDNMQPYQTLNWVIALNGIYPSQG